MRRGRRCVWAFSAIGLGILIILGVILPGVFWWLLLAGALLTFGIWLLRCC